MWFDLFDGQKRQLCDFVVVDDNLCVKGGTCRIGLNGECKLVMLTIMSHDDSPE